MTRIMFRSFKFSLGPRVAALVAGSVFVAVVLIAGLLAFYQLNQNIEVRRKSLESIAIVYATAVSDYYATRDIHAMKTVLRSVARVEGIINASAIDSDGRALASLGQKAILEHQHGDSYQLSLLETDHVLIAVDVIKGGQKMGQLVLLADTTEQQQAFFQNLIYIFVAAALACIFTIGLSVPIQKRITGPLRNLTEKMRSFATEQQHVALPLTNSGDETDLLIGAFNGLISDVSARDAELRKIAFFDNLTGLQNSASLSRKLENVLQGGAAASPFTLLLVSVHDHGRFENAFGISVGQKLVVFVAQKLAEIAPPGSEVARLGNARFAILVPGISEKDKAEQLIGLIQSFFYLAQNIGGIDFHLTLNASAMLLPKDAENSADAMRRANLTLDLAEKAGPGRAIIFSNAMEEEAQLELELSRSLRQAIENNDIESHFQPQYEIKTGLIAGFEALARWTHPTRGPVSPAVFVPIAERSGTIAALGDTILRQATKIARQHLSDSAHTVSIAVNVSPAQILQSGFVARVDEALRLSGLPAQRLCLEITESLFIGSSISGVRMVLDDLRKRGIQLALDDFGTGYSSLHYLSQLPFDKLKIDRSFVRGASNNERRRELLKSIIQMAQGLNMQIIAEGAETSEDMALLESMGADMIQGYFISKPLPPDRTVEFLRDWNTTALLANAKSA